MPICLLTLHAILDMAERFLLDFSDEDIIASSGLTRHVFVEVYNKYCGFDTPINR